MGKHFIRPEKAFFVAGTAFFFVAGTAMGCGRNNPFLKTGKVFYMSGKVVLYNRKRHFMWPKKKHYLWPEKRLMISRDHILPRRDCNPIFWRRGIMRGKILRLRYGPGQTKIMERKISPSWIFMNPFDVHYVQSMERKIQHRWILMDPFDKHFVRIMERKISSD